VHNGERKGKDIVGERKTKKKKTGEER